MPTDDDLMWRVAGGARSGVNADVFGGRAGNDSNALTEVWPTGAGFAFDVADESVVVVIAPRGRVPDDLAVPDYSRFDG